MTVRLLQITAAGHPDGNRIDLSWAYPPPEQGAPPAGVRVVRGEDTHPVTPEDGHLVAQGIGLVSTSDTRLRGERAYYYTLFPFTGDPPAYQPDPHNQVSALATAPYDLAGLMYGMLPALYQRYDTAGQLRDFLDLPGAELDRLYSLAGTALDLTDLDRVEGSLLPLLAGWIGWRTNHRLPVGAQRGEIRIAPRVYQAIGGMPTLEASVARISGVPAHTKEFVHNVARTNQPERLNLWATVRAGGGTTWTDPELVSVNANYEGRPATVREADGSVSVFYQTQREHGADIWSKRFAGGQWRPSFPVVDRPGTDTNPSATLQGGTLWLFWQSFDGQRWGVWFARRVGDSWRAPERFGEAERRLPAVVADNTGGVWLFWLERTAGAWQLRYKRFTSVTDLNTGAGTAFPLDAGAQPRVEEDLHVLFHPTSPNQRLWLFWSRRDTAAGQTRWSTVYRVKQALDPAATDWSPIRAVPRTGTYHDRQPAALLLPGGDIELFWASTKDGGWSVVRAVLATATNTVGASTRIVTDAFTKRAPLVADIGTGTLVAYRSNRSIRYASQTFGATSSLDHRYAGTSTVDTGATAKRELRGRFEDFQTYTYGTGGRIARDAVGLYLTPRDDVDLAAAIAQLAGALGEFMPVTTRPVFITP